MIGDMQLIARKIRRELGWIPSYSFETGLQKTLDWYVREHEWCTRIANGSYRLIKKLISLENIDYRCRRTARL